MNRRNMKHLGVLVLGLFCVLALTACATTKKAQEEPQQMAALTEKTVDGNLVERFDLTGDRKPNVWKVYRTGQKDGKSTKVLIRKDLDPNLDGRPDVSQYFNAGGILIKESFDLDFDGQVDAESIYEGGTLVRRRMDLDFNGRFDVQKFYFEGKLIRKERDKDNNGRVDIWEYFQGDRLMRVGYDKNGDGKPEVFEDAPEPESGSSDTPETKPAKKQPVKDPAPDPSPEKAPAPKESKEGTVSA